MSKRRRKNRKSPGKTPSHPHPDRGNKDLSFWMVAFMDLLGYRSLLNGFDVFPFPTEAVELARVREALAKAVHVRQRLHTSLEAFLKGNELAPDLEAEVPVHLRDLVRSVRSIRLISSPGPDHYILAASLARSELNFPVRSAYTLVIAAASGMLVQLARGADDPTDTLPLRGGIDIAAGIVGPPDNFLYSPSVVRAYELEGEARYPRTLIGARVVDFVRSVSEMPGADLPAQHARDIAQRMQTMFFVDSDGKVALDFYGEAIRETFGVEPARTLAHKAWDYARAAESTARSQGKPKITEKYEWLLAYMEPRRKIWD
jgi:hypothetical protein